MTHLATLAHPHATHPQLAFVEWKAKLYETAAAEGRVQHIQRISDHALVLFWVEGCEPTITKILTFSEGKEPPLAA
jgi:hypothetical protein